jgi:hypothetical protein
MGVTGPRMIRFPLTPQRMRKFLKALLFGHFPMGFSACSIPAGFGPQRRSVLHEIILWGLRYQVRSNVACQHDKSLRKAGCLLGHVFIHIDTDSLHAEFC